MTRASRRESKRHELSNSSRMRPLNDSIQAFCQGDPGSMNNDPVSFNRHQSLTAWAREFGSRVEPHVVRLAVLCGQAVEDVDDTVGVDGPVEVDR